MVKLEDILPPKAGGIEEYSCSELSRIVGRHPNTLRKYETWGFVGEIPRKANGYRRYSRRHALQALFSVIALRSCFQEWKGRRRIKAIIGMVLAADYEGARATLETYRQELGKGLEQARSARAILEAWRKRGPCGDRGEGTGLLRSEAASRTGVSPDTLRDWERSSLVEPRRLPNGRRVYSSEDMERLAIVALLRQADFSLLGIRSLLKGKTAIEDLSFARDRWDETLRGFLDDCRLLEEILEEMSRIR
jgi:DNA-binding transcriptional MerR regulator